MKIKWTWQCNSCNDILTSHSYMRHQMDICKCGKSGVDLEEHYCRGMGKYTIRSIEEEVNGKWVKVKR